MQGIPVELIHPGKCEVQVPVLQPNEVVLDERNGMAETGLDDLSNCRVEQFLVFHQRLLKD
jgi:hypothetical protein